MPTRAKRMPKRIKPRKRESATKRGYNYRWQKESRRWLAVNPLCVECKSEGRLTPATCVDHIKPHRGNMQLFWESSNWQGLCDQCHTAKTARGE